MIDGLDWVGHGMLVSMLGGLELVAGTSWADIPKAQEAVAATVAVGDVWYIGSAIYHFYLGLFDFAFNLPSNSFIDRL